MRYALRVARGVRQCNRARDVTGAQHERLQAGALDYGLQIGQRCIEREIRNTPVG